MTPRHFLHAPTRPRDGRRQDSSPYELNRLGWTHAFPDS